MPVAIECHGSPRDMGLDQGEACRNAIRTRLARDRSPRRRAPFSLRPLISGRVLGLAPASQIVRHHAHQAERLAGIALAAGASLESLMALYLQEAIWRDLGAPGSPPFLSVARGPSGTDASTGVLRSLPQSSAAAGSASVAYDRVVRHSRPETGFASVELVLPWSAAALAGVNESGLAGALSPLPGTLCAAPAGAAVPALLLQDCLQRFAEVDAALEWCLKRPANGGACVVLADATGAVGAVELRGEERRVLRAADGVLVVAGDAAVESRLRESLKLDAALGACAATLGGDGPGAVASPGWVELHPISRQLSLHEPGEAEGTRPVARFSA